MSTSKRLSGLVALVTGADRGVGKGIALELARAGCQVAVNYHTEPELAERAVAEIADLGIAASKKRAPRTLSGSNDSGIETSTPAPRLIHFEGCPRNELGSLHKV